ncbi:MAG: hypothetical protein PHN90_05505 [Methanothrix sp.]|nr:hypothetical protein [Methanothrix sp.]
MERKRFKPSRRHEGVALHLSRSQIFAILEELKAEYPNEVAAWVESQAEDGE